MDARPPWSETIRLGELARGPVLRRLEAGEAARRAVARHLGLVALDRLEADLALAPWLDGAQIEGGFVAEAIQTCGVTGEAFPERIEGRIALRVLPEGSPNAPQGAGEEIDLDPEAEDPPDLLEGDLIDLAAYVVEHLSLELDPFPRKPGAVFSPPEERGEISPFAVLATLSKTPPEG
ncbi:MAG: YceD family protein [Pseudomonadota bacterium]